MSPEAQRFVLWLVPGAPLAAAIAIALLGKRSLKESSHWPCWAALATSAACALILLFKVTPSVGFEAVDGRAAGVVASGFSWLDVGGMHIRMDLRIDAMSALMLAMVTTVSFLVSLFAAGYMHGDPGYPRFFASFSLFVFSMCMLVLSANFLQLFVFWEGVGLCSYLLIGFWFQKPSAAAAAKKAFVVNRVGDFGFLMAIFFIWTTFGSLDFTDVLFSPTKIFALAEANPGRFTLICSLLLVGAMGKSAQFPLHVWLPDAMEGPTPVSALIHAATMVTAGVYLVARSTPLFIHAPSVQIAACAIGATTALMAAIIAVTQFDLKRVLAYSTVSQLGYMFMALGVGAAGNEALVTGVGAAMFHLVTHGFFKALLFLAAGSVMHAMHDVIDMRRFSGLRRALPITHATFLCGAAALAGVPLLAAFWSKDEILLGLHEASAHPQYGLFFTWIGWIASFTALLTAFYTFRAYFMTFWGPERFPEEAGHHPHEATPIMAWPLRLLAIGALFIGAVGGATHAFAHYISHSPSLPAVEAHHAFDLKLMATSGALALLGIAAAWQLYVRSPSVAKNLGSSMQLLYALSTRKFWIDEILGGLVVTPLRFLGRLFFATDVGVIDRIVDGVGSLPRLASAWPRRLQTGLVSSYALVMWLGVLVCITAMLGYWNFS